MDILTQFQYVQSAVKSIRHLHAVSCIQDVEEIEIKIYNKNKEVQIDDLRPITMIKVKRVLSEKAAQQMIARIPA